MSESPSTSRVIAILEALAASAEPLASAHIARDMGLSTSTTAVVLKTLEEARYVERLPDKSYRLGRGLLRLVAGLEREFPLLGAANEELDRLHADLGLGCSLARLDAVSQEVVLTAGPTDLLGIRPGVRLPMDPPLGTIAMAWQSPERIDNWLRSGGEAVSREEQLELVAHVRELGFAVFGMERTNEHVAAQVYDILTSMQSTESAESLRLQLARLAFQFATRIHAKEQLLSQDLLRVSHIIVPVFGADAQPAYLLALHVMQSAMPRKTCWDYVARVEKAADALVVAIGGRRPAD